MFKSVLHILSLPIILFVMGISAHAYAGEIKPGDKMMPRGYCLKEESGRFMFNMLQTPSTNQYKVPKDCTLWRYPFVVNKVLGQAKAGVGRSDSGADVVLATGTSSIKENNEFLEFFYITYSNYKIEKSPGYRIDKITQISFLDNFTETVVVVFIICNNKDAGLVLFESISNSSTSSLELENHLRKTKECFKRRSWAALKQVIAYGVDWEGDITAFIEISASDPNKRFFSVIWPHHVVSQN